MCQACVDRMKSKRLRIFKSPWHTAHDHDLIMALSDIADFSLLINYTRRWDDKNRPLPDNTEWVTHYEKGKYDLVILNIDQQCSLPGINKAVLTRHMKEAIRSIDSEVPIVFINHGTPVYPEAFPDGSKATNFVSEELRQQILAIVGTDYMVVNSHQGKEEWNHPNSRAIIHGMNPDEWMYSELREPRSCTYVSPAGIGDKYYNRSFLIQVMENLKEKHGIMHQWIGTPGCYQNKGIKDYKEFLSKSLIYFNPTFASPMPRSRTEAMLSGCCIVTTPEHDAASFIQDGVNGFIVPSNDPYYASEVIARLTKNYDIAVEVGKKGRETAMKIFSRERYRQDWVNLLTDLKIL